MTYNLVIANTYGARVYFRLPVIASTERCVAIRSASKGNTDSFALRTQNDKAFSCYERRKMCAVSCCPVIAREQCDRGNPFLF